MFEDKEGWLNCLVVGDEVYTIERNWKIPGETWKWKSTIVALNKSYIETVYCRERGVPWLEKMVADLTVNHRTYERTWVKNYFAPDGTINIQKI